MSIVRQSINPVTTKAIEGINNQIISFRTPLFTGFGKYKQMEPLPTESDDLPLTKLILEDVEIINRPGRNIRPPHIELHFPRDKIWIERSSSVPEDGTSSGYDSSGGKRRRRKSKKSKKSKKTRKTRKTRKSLRRK